jgi:hypothetical protein
MQKMSPPAQPSITIVSASDARYFDLIKGLVLSLRSRTEGGAFALSVFDLGLTTPQRAWLADQDAGLVEPEWHFDFPGREEIPVYFKALAARPAIPQYFPGYQIYFWIDADVWIQDHSALRIFVDAAAAGKLAIVPEVDRSYWTIHKRPRLWGQNQKCFAWSYGLVAGYRYGRHPILNAGVFALPQNAPHWQLYGAALRRALTRRRLSHRPRRWNLCFALAEQTALNYVVFADRAPATFLPAYCNWFCGKGTPMYDPERQLLVEPNAPYAPLGLVHLAGERSPERCWTLATPQGGSVESKLTYEAVRALRTGDDDRACSAAASSIETTPAQP